MEDTVPFASREYLLFLLVLLLARGMDFLSTWVATPNLLLEGNPIARKLGWRWGVPVNVALCLSLACWPLPAIVVSTTSLLVAARNFQSAWLMRSMGEQRYREWHFERLRESGLPLYLVCLLGQTILVASVGFALAFIADAQRAELPLAIGMGIVAYALAVFVFTLLGVWRFRRSALRMTRPAVSIAPPTPDNTGAEDGGSPATLLPRKPVRPFP
jgi:hypothetical protein